VKGRNWRQRSAGRRFSAVWKPWYSVLPTRGRGVRINERQAVGIRDLVAEPSAISSRPDRRWIVVGVVFASLTMLLVARVYTLQILNSKTSIAQVQSNSLRVSDIPAARGEILDRAGVVLVGNQLTTEVTLSRVEARANPTMLGSLATLFHEPLSQLMASINNVNYNSYQSVPILAATPSDVAEYLTLHAAEFPGVSLIKVSQRVYPQGGTTGAHVLGYVGPITGAELASVSQQGYTTNSAIGKSGLEQFYESFLRGHSGKQTLQVNRNGVVLTSKVTEVSRVGNSLVTNIDAGLQQALETYLAQTVIRCRTTYDPETHGYPVANSASAVVMDVRTGQVLAMSSYPNYDLNNFVDGLSQAQYKTLSASGAFSNYAIQGLYAPGSTFKMITATAQLQTGIFPPYRYYNDPGKFVVPECQVGGSGCVFHDDDNSASGLVNLPLALTKSSDVYFYNLGNMFYTQRGKYGPTAIQNVADKYGLNLTSQVDLPNEVSGRIDSPTVRLTLHQQAPGAFPNTSWYAGDNIEMAFGQGATVMTPIEQLVAYSALANGGIRYAPEVVAAVVSPTGKVLQRYSPRVTGRINLPPKVRNPIIEGLIGVVNSPSGTAYATFKKFQSPALRKYTVAGKTGTASNARGLEPNSWFVGFFPAENPQYAAICVVGQGGFGRVAGAPVVAQAFSYLAEHPVGEVRIAVNPSLTPVTTAIK